MALVTADLGEPSLLNNMVSAVDRNMHLYTNNYTPVAGMTLGSFTEATFAGSTYVTLSAGSWNAATEISGQAVATYANQTWTKTDSGSVTVYGYFCTSSDNGTILWAELFDVSRTLGNGDSVTVSPQMALQSQN